MSYGPYCFIALLLDNPEQADPLKPEPKPSLLKIKSTVILADIDPFPKHLQKAASCFLKGVGRRFFKNRSILTPY